MVLLPALISSDVIEIEHLRDINPYIDSEETLLVFDIDNTLLEAEGYLGSVAWGEFLIRNVQSKNISAEKAEEVVSVVWRSVQPHINVKPVDCETGQIVRDMQARKIQLMCLTARVPEEMAYTFKQLDSIGIDVSLTAPRNEPIEISTFKRTICYDNGVLFATPLNKKSEAFLAFLSACNISCGNVIFVDDKRHHAKDMQDTLQREGIPCTAFHFTGARSWP